MEEKDVDAKRLYELSYRSCNPNAKAEDMPAVYTEWAPYYDQDMRAAGFEKSIIGCIRTKVGPLCEKDKNQRILDIGAGTGLVGLAMTNEGLTNLDALDMSKDMLKVATEKGIYKNMILARLGDTLPIPDNSYDTVVGVGMFLNAHGTPTCFPEIIRIIKPGGHFFHVCLRSLKLWMDTPRETDPYLEDYDRKVLQHCENGDWELVERVIYPEYFGIDDGVMFTCKIKK